MKRVMGSWDISEVKHLFERLSQLERLLSKPEEIYMLNKTGRDTPQKPSSAQLHAARRRQRLDDASLTSFVLGIGATD